MLQPLDITAEDVLILVESTVSHIESLEDQLEEKERVLALDPNNVELSMETEFLRTYIARVSLVRGRLQPSLDELDVPVAS